MLDLVSAFTSTTRYWLTLHEVVFQKKGYSELTCFKDDLQAHVQVYSLGLIFWLWSRPHYRCKDFKQDMIDNLRNVAVPGTGIPLSVFCHSWWICLFFVSFINPFICFMGAVNKVRLGSKATGGKSLFKLYEDHLLHPQDWFSYWRLNCRLASVHSLLLKPAGYNLEDKWTFLKEGAAAGVPVSPFMSEPVDLVIKNKNIEGGLGIYFYKNAVHGGDWIVQSRLQNAKWLNRMLPKPAPLSTMRVITSSSWTMAKHGHKFKEGKYRVYDRQGNVVEDETEGTKFNTNFGIKASKASSDVDAFREAEKYIVARSAVLRLGRAGASTDHSSVLFDVDINSGQVLQGTSNQHWYKLGLHQAAPGACPWLPQGDGFTRHPDLSRDKPEIAGQHIAECKAAREVVLTSHYKLLPDVPMVGWDVAFCADGIYLLEVNLSCNFFRGTFDVPEYISFVDEHFRDLEQRASMGKL